VYNRLGRQVKSTVNGVTSTVYIGNYYEKEGNTVRTYYYHAGKRVAMREDGTLYWLLTDHPSLTLRASLGSTAMALTASGAPAAERRYYAYGDERDISGTLYTQYGFTGQREEADIARFSHSGHSPNPSLRAPAHHRYSSQQGHRRTEEEGSRRPQAVPAQGRQSVP